MVALPQPVRTCLAVFTRRDRQAGRARHGTGQDDDTQTRFGAAIVVDDDPIPGTPNGPIPGTPNGPIHGPIPGPIHGAADRPIPGPVPGPVPYPIHGTADRPIHGTADGAIHGTANGAIHGAAGGAIDLSAAPVGTPPGAFLGTQPGAPHGTPAAPPPGAPGRALARPQVAARTAAVPGIRARHAGPIEPVGLEEPGEPATYRAMDLALRIGELMLASGESTETVADAMCRVTRVYGLPHSEANVTFAAISLSYLPGQGAPPVTGERRVRRRLPDYSRLIDVHRLVRAATKEALNLDQAFARLREIKLRRTTHPAWLLVVALASIAASASVMVGGGPQVAFAAFAATVLGERAGAWLGRRGVAEFYQMAVAAAIGSAVAVLMIWTDVAAQASAVVIGSVIALLPGRPLVTSLQDGIAGDFVTAAARLLEVFFILAGIIAGVGMTLYVGIRLGAPIYLDSPPQAPPRLHAAQLLGGIGVSAAFAVSLLLPWSALLPVGIGGALSWSSYAALRSVEVPPVLAAFVAAAVVGVLGTAYACSRRLPPCSYVVPAIAPLLPGTALYTGMLELNIGAPTVGALTLVQAVSTALALGAGVNLGTEVVRAVSTGGVRRRLRPAARRTRGY
jgi:uncharacterized membrane protein YjjP (DUF1212 family)